MSEDWARVKKEASSLRKETGKGGLFACRKSEDDGRSAVHLTMYSFAPIGHSSA